MSETVPFWSCFFVSNELLFIFKNRYLGYKQAIIDSGLEFDESLVIETISKVFEGRETTKLLLAMEGINF